jgi:solute carrier family 25 citrate transporter 1
MEKTEDNENEKTSVIPSSSSTTMTSLNQFIAGGASGLLSRLVTHPMDTMKSRMQVGSKTLNINGAYKGFGAVAIGSPVASGMYFMGYETTKACLKSVRGGDDDDQQTLVLENVLTGIVAQALAGIAYTPVDVVKERMQVSSVLPTHLKTNNGVDYRNALDAVRTILKNEGVKNGLMRGYWAQNFVWWPWSACYFAAYEKGLEMFRRTKSNAKEEGEEGEEGGEYYRYVSPHAASAFTAATCATILTHPLDLCKTRVQTMTSSSSSSSSNSVAEKLTMRRVFTDVVRKEGFFALYRGVWARILSVAPGSAISFYAYESIRKSGVLRLEDE